MRPIIRSARLAAVPLAAALIGTTLAPGIADARHTPAVPQFALAQETWSYSSNPAAPPDCLNEDDFHYRNWSGGIGGVFQATERLCDYASDGWSAGGVGLQADVYVTGTLGDLSITSPGGARQPAVLMGETRVKGGATRRYYSVCVMPPFFASTNTGTNPLAGGTWTFTLSGQATVDYEVRAIMGYPDQQRLFCPPGQQNVAP